ncbi:hypothetical protein Droror1_Dr00019635 [Drosera rotundifolia]
MEAAVTMSMPMNNGLGMTMQRGVLRNRGLVNDGRNSWLSVQRVVGMRKVGRVLAVHIGKELKERRPQNVAGEGRVLRRGDIADHEKWSKRLNCERILHSTEVQESTFGVERKLEGTGPWSLWPDIDLIHTPGHTEGSVCLYHKPLKVLLTGRSSSLVGFWTIHLADV